MFVPLFLDFTVLGSRLDADTHATSCRMAFHGVLGHTFCDKNYASSDLPRFKIYKEKKKEGVAERANNECEVICRGMFKKETNLALFSGLHVTLSTGEKGKIGESFGQSGKFKVWIPGEHLNFVQKIFDVELNFTFCRRTSRVHYGGVGRQEEKSCVGWGAGETVLGV
jgi:selenocysteine-specific elongation factor